MSEKIEDKVYFSDIFQVKHSVVESYGALDVSLVCDNPAFVDPFLIFANPEYKNLHDFIVAYLRFLRDLSIKNQGYDLNDGNFNQYYKFPEVKQAWLGYSVSGNAGLGLGLEFAESLYKNLHKIFSKFGDEKITETSHLEKLCLIENGVGVDKISDFTLNLIKKFLLEYTQEFANKYLDKRFLTDFAVRKVEFNLEKGIWMDAHFMLPTLERDGKKDFVLLVPKSMLAREDTWISRNDFLENDVAIFEAIPNAELRAKVNKFFFDNLKIKFGKDKKPEKDYSKKSKAGALLKTVWEYPDLLDYYIKSKEQKKNDALKMHVAVPEDVNFFLDAGEIKKEFAKKKIEKMTSLDDCIARLNFFKKTLESNSNDLYLKGRPLQENQLQLMFKNTTYGSLFDYNSEVDNGRGPIDFIISYGSQDKAGLELKRASNSKLKKNLLNQGRVYQEASNLKCVIKAIFFFSDMELQRVNGILQEIRKPVDNREIFLIDCRKKLSASNV